MSNIICRLRLSGYTLRQRVTHAEIRQHTGRHTLVLLTTRVDGGPVSQQTYLPEGTAAQLIWGAANNRATTWYGYVRHREVNSDGALLLGLVGTSDVLNTSTSRSWSGVSASYVARTIAQDAGFRSYVHASPVLDYIAQEGDTDYQLLCRLAREQGYRLWVDGATLYFTSARSAIISPWLRSVPIVRHNHSARDTLKTFEIIQGTASPVGGIAARRVVYGLDTSSGLLTQAVSNPTASDRTVIAEAVADSYTDALLWADAQSGLNDDWVSATATLQGDVRVAPGNLLQVAGTHVPPGYDGLWLVESADHRLDLNKAGTYSTSVTLGRNARTAYQLSDVHQQHAASEFASCQLQAGRWRSSDLREVVYGAR